MFAQPWQKSAKKTKKFSTAVPLRAERVLTAGHDRKSALRNEIFEKSSLIQYAQLNMLFKASISLNITFFAF